MTTVPPPKAIVHLARELKAQFDWIAIQFTGSDWQVAIDAEHADEAIARGYNVFPGPSFAIVMLTPED